MTAAHGLRDPAGHSALGAEGSASCATAVGGALPEASGHPRAAAGPAAIAGVGRPPAAAAPHCASQPRPPAPRGEAGGPAFRSPRRFAPSPPCPLRAGAHVALPTVRSCRAPAATPGPRWRRRRVKRVRKGSGRERGTVGALRSRAPRCPRNPGRRFSGKAGGRGQEVRDRRSTAADGGAARSPWHTAAGRHPRLGRGRRDSTGSGRRGNRDRGEGGRQGTMLGSDRCISMPLCAVRTAPLPPPSAGAAAGLRLRPQLGAQTPARSPGASILWVRSSAARRAAPC